MTEKLTLQDCLLYPKAKIQEIFGDELVIYNNILDRLVESDYPYWEDLSNCKLILREIGDLTDEEKRYLKDNFIYITHERLFMSSTQYADYIQCIPTGKVKDFIDWCRENSFDVDGMLDSRKAVKE